MNPLIEQLAEQCWVHTKEPLFGAKSPHWEFDRQKFAELIVRECVRYFNEDYQRDFDTVWREDLSKSIKEHFGVEE